MTTSIEFVNLTPHTITIIKEDGENIIIAPSGIVARCKATNIAVGEINGVPVVKAVYGEVEGLPAPQEDKYYLVSGFVMTALQGSGRTDVLKPEEFVRDENGVIIGCRKLSYLD